MRNGGFRERRSAFRNPARGTGRVRLRLPEGPVRCEEFVLDFRERAVHLDLLLSVAENGARGQVDGRVLGIVAGQREELRLFVTVNQAANVRPVKCSGAHRAGFAG